MKPYCAVIINFFKAATGKRSFFSPVFRLAIINSPMRIIDRHTFS